ncbi:MAG: hypothetical protein E6Q33_02460 [Neisseriales bacterium]|nr:MAG: hypothetical protein E6Q33_02460 [Neisseriales bacterium]
MVTTALNKLKNKRIKSRDLKVRVMPELNLTALYRNRTNRQALEPTHWVFSDEYRLLRDRVTELTGVDEVSIDLDASTMLESHFTYSRYIYLAYFKHCFGNDINVAIEICLSEFDDNDSKKETTGVKHD